MKSSSSKIKLPNINSASRKQFKDLKIFTTFNKKDDDPKWAQILSGTWEIEIPVDEFMNALESPAAATPTIASSTVNDPNSVSNRQMPMVQISDELKVISLPLSTDIANPEIHKRYLSAKSISSNATRLKIEGKDGVKLILGRGDGAADDDHNHHQHHSNHNSNHHQQIESSLSTQEHDSIDDGVPSSVSSVSPSTVVMEGTLSSDSFTIRWMDGSSWTKQGVASSELDEHDEEQREASSSHAQQHEEQKAGNYNKDYEAELSGLRAQLEILKEKEQMAKSSSQATMGQLADLSQQYAKLSMEHEQVQKTHQETTHKYASLQHEFDALSTKHCASAAELDRVKTGMQFAQQQEMQMQHTKLKAENTAYAQSIKSQQERILSLQDQLQSTQLTQRQYTKNIEDLETRIAESEQTCAASQQALRDVNAKLIGCETLLDEEKHDAVQLKEKQAADIDALMERHTQEIEKLERGFQETLRQNEKKMQDLQTLRNNYEKKNASLTKDVKKLIVQLEKQTKSYSARTRRSQHVSAELLDVDDEALRALRGENAQLSEELIRKSQSLVDALNALAEFHSNPDTVKAITSQLSHAPQYMDQQHHHHHHHHHDHNGNGYEHHQQAQHVDEALKSKSVSSYADVSNHLQLSMEHDMKQTMSLSPSAISSSSHTVSPLVQTDAAAAAAAVQHADVATSPVVIGAQFSVHDIASQQSKFGRFKTRVGHKMKEQITKVQKQMVTHQIQKHKHSEQESLNELHAKSVIKETEKVLSMKTRQQLSTQCDELQALANELSSTIEQKEVILESLRFANTYLGKRVIAIEKLSKMQPGQLILNQDQLIRDAINSTNDDAAADVDDDDDDDSNDGNVSANDTTLLQFNVSTSRVRIQVTPDGVAPLQEDVVANDNEHDVDRVALSVVESDVDLLRPKNTMTLLQSPSSAEQKTMESDTADKSSEISTEHSQERQHEQRASDLIDGDTNGDGDDDAQQTEHDNIENQAMNDEVSDITECEAEQQQQQQQQQQLEPVVADEAASETPH